VGLERQEIEVATRVARGDVMLSTERISSRVAPPLITKDMAKPVKPGMAIVDTTAGEGAAWHRRQLPVDRHRPHGAAARRDHHLRDQSAGVRAGRCQLPLRPQLDRSLSAQTTPRTRRRTAVLHEQEDDRHSAMPRRWPRRWSERQSDWTASGGDTNAAVRCNPCPATSQIIKCPEALIPGDVRRGSFQSEPVCCDENGSGLLWVDVRHCRQRLHRHKAGA
jgi:hypothetical protein